MTSMSMSRSGVVNFRNHCPDTQTEALVRPFTLPVPLKWSVKILSYRVILSCPWIHDVIRHVFLRRCNRIVNQIWLVCAG